MLRFAQTADAIAATTRKLEKTRLVADYFKATGVREAAVSSVFLSGRPFPVWEETTLQIGGRLLWRVVAELAGQDESALTDAYRKLGDLGAVAEAVLTTKHVQDLSVMDVEAAFRQIAVARGTPAKTELVRDLLNRVTPLEAKYIVKIMTGDLRIGLKESLVEEAIGKAHDATLREVQRANMLLGDIGETLRFAAEGKLAQAKMRLFHPLGFMLASPIETAEEGLTYFPDAAVEDKYDGIRAQAHFANGKVKLFSRTRDEITESFPELEEAFAQLDGEAILDGEIVAWYYPAELEQTQQVVDETLSDVSHEKASHLGQAQPFSVLQQRLGRKKVSDRMLREIPVAYLAFDVLYVGGQLAIDLPLRKRARILDEILAADGTIHHGVTLRPGSGQAPTQRKAKYLQSNWIFDTEEKHAPASIIRTPVFRAASSDELEELFAAAQGRGNEGLMIKDLNSPYSPGKRGKSWLKMKRELATLDVVVTTAEYGHGKRIGVLSDYTFAVWDRDRDGNTDKDRLVNIGKAYSGLTDVEIAEMTKWFLEHTLEDQGFRRIVEPKIVLEVAFNNMMQSDRHESGYALRFPRIVRLRPDKSAEEADTIERARKIYEEQGKNPRPKSVSS
jgi:DNA ligase-1